METLAIQLADYYKFAHAGQYDESINKLVSYFTPRSCRLPDKDYVVNFGVQAFCKEYLIEKFNNEFFNVPYNDVKIQVFSFLTNTLPGIDVNEEVNRIMSLHKLGYLPISIRTLPEGSKVRMGCPNVELVTTHPEFSWIGGFIESLMSSYLWKPMIDATVGHWYREVVNRFYESTVDNWKLKAKSAMSEFGFRGADTPDSGIHSGTAWLLSFDKTATCAAISFINKYYNMRFPGGVYPIDDYISDYHKYLLENQDKPWADKKLHDELNSFMEDNISWHNITTLDKTGRKRITALPLGYEDYPDWFIPDEVWNKYKEFSYNGKLLVRTGKWTYDLVDFNEGIVGKGLISTEHSVMCSGIQLRIDKIKSMYPDITNGFNKFWEDESKGEISVYEPFLDLSSEVGRIQAFMSNMISEPNLNYISSETLKNNDKVIIGKYIIDRLLDIYELQEIAEKDLVHDLLTKVYSNSSFSMVSDSYDYWRLVTSILPELKDEILGRTSINSDFIDLTDKINERYKVISSIEENKNYSENALWRASIIKESMKFLKNNESLDKCYFVKDENIYLFKTIINEGVLNIEYYSVGKCPTLFVRGDSGDPVKIVAGYLDISEFLSNEDKLKLKTNGYVSMTHVNDLLDIIKDVSKKLDSELLINGDFISEYCYITIGDKFYRIYLDFNEVEIVLDNELPKYIAYGTVSMLAEIFGTTLNSKGFSVLDPHIRVIYGDSITQKRAEMIYSFLKYKGLSSENVALGAGSFSFHAYEGYNGNLYPYTRDTFGCAMKATYGECKDGTNLMIYKDPKTNNNSDVVKKSMRGCCSIYEKDGYYYLDHDGLTLSERELDSKNELIEVFINGHMTKEITFSQIRNTLNEGNF